MDPDLIVMWVGILGIIVVVHLFYYLNRCSRYHLLEKLAEKGPLTPELLAQIDSIKEKIRTEYENHPLRSGSFLTCVGIALVVTIGSMQGGIPLEHGWLIRPPPGASDCRHAGG